jgi:hypothetical protein
VPSYEKSNYEFGKKLFDKSGRRLEGSAFDPEARTIEEQRSVGAGRFD